MRYIGGKSKLLRNIGELIAQRAIGVKKIIDIFSGSGVVASYLKAQSYEIIGNDILYFAYVLSRGTTVLNRIPDFENLGISSPMNYLNNLTLESSGFNVENCFIYQNYSAHDEVNRMYFQPDNAVKIDIIRMTIEKWKNESIINTDEYFYLLAALIAAVPYVSNITGVYGAYLKYWDKRTYNPLRLLEPTNISDTGDAVFYNLNCDELLPKISADLLYADPPYNNRQYLPNYHILETIAKYDRPKIHGVTGMRNYSDCEKSDFCSRAKVEEAFQRMLKNANVRYVVISYNSEGLLSKEQLSDICLEFAKKDSFHCHDVTYRRYSSKFENKAPKVAEQIYFFEKAHICP